MATVAVFGSCGAVGIEIARNLAAVPEVTRLVLCDINEKVLYPEANDAAMYAEKLRQESVEVLPRVVDMRNTDNIAKLLDEVKPDVVVQAAIPVSWYTLANSVPPDIWKRVNWEARMGPFLPLLLSFPVKFMQGWKAAGGKSKVIQLSFPDVVNPVLAGMGLAPTCGSGNTENLATTLRLVCASRFKVPTRDIEIRLVAHHYHCWFMKSRSTEADLAERPFIFRVYCQQVDRTAELAADPTFIADVRQRYPYQRPRFAATSVAKNVMRMLRNDPTLSHVSSPGARGGGMDARFVDGTWTPVLPAGVTMAEVEACYAKARAGDGIVEIAADGAVRYSDGAYQAMKDLLKYDCAVLKPAEIEAQGNELLTRIKTLRG